MKRMWMFLVAVLFLFVCSASAQQVNFPQEPPILVSQPEIVNGYSKIAWDANTEEDLGGYIVGYSLGGSGYVYGEGRTFDVGNIVEMDFVNYPSEVWALMAVAGQKVWMALYAYDQASGIPDSTYQEGDNVSGASNSVSIDFFVDQAPLATQNVRVE